MIVANEGAVARPRQEPCIDEGAEHRVTGGLVQTPEAPCLLRCQA
ncbi:MAG TPA: hypothetical protein VFA59_23360 [Vicinamibacterales bacterium]|nr:hypothetical protein [Vicinamibacterales bacterium]